jgi:membrane protease YdiL (CAAX protease family)
MSSFSDPPALQNLPDPPNPPGQLREGDVFIGPYGLRAGWRISIYIALVVALGAVLRFSAELIQHARHHAAGGGNPGEFTPVVAIVSELFLAIIVLGAAGIMSRIEHRAPGVYGMPAREALGKRFWQGMAWGLAAVSALVGSIAIVGGYSFGPLALSSRMIVQDGVLWMIAFFLVGVFEEFSFRGYLQYTLGQGIGFWPSAVILSALFGAVHLGNPGEGWIGALSVFEIAMFFALTLRRTGNLWFAIGLHCSFDWGETFLYSVPNSGNVAEGALSHSTLHGAKWITGGTIGPEGSLFCFLIVLLMFFVFERLYPAKVPASPSGV